MTTPSIPIPYRVVMAIGTPAVRWWGRLEVRGLENLPSSGPTVVMANHDSQWDPVIAGIAALRVRHLRALAKDSLWKNPVVGRWLTGMGQIPIARGRGDATALQAAIDVLREGGCIGIFPEGTVSRGRTMRFLSGAGRLALAVPGTTVVGLRITGQTDVVRFPKRPRIVLEFLTPTAAREGESAVALTKRVMQEVRTGAPPAIPGRAKTAAKYRELAAEHAAAQAAEKPADKAS
ncbi:1-acyl-sn-glycerol-3-phosphate acyltransferase [Klenkia marina]|uniref:1-acyl-sn-glycerol-3-phosphate acyltransferase n=1 Tax=Klenkia marina TaxID=1960309 RepID=A0A1G4YMV7_9ACTN|nr:lysophospholipid acyltransferase family protein [Klenkia marina]SCX54684.1 1-acyl-sn-glycerol-3-phosphate acyltransferase [Klenkia marina]